jgi:hypothetical protein
MVKFDWWRRAISKSQRPETIHNMLNPILYNALKRAVASKHLPGNDVKVKGQNETFKGKYYTDPLSHRKRVKKDQEGETYWICCPCCGDTRYRLCINYKWGIYDEDAQSKNKHLIHCFNEECQSNGPDLLEKLESAVKSIGGRNKSQLPPKSVKEVPQEEKPLPLPGLVANVKDLPPTHPASQFLLSRGFDPRLLGEHFGVEFCYTSTYPFANNRVIFPVRMHQELVGWQARYIDGAGGGDVTGLHFCRSCRATARFESKQRVCTRCRTEALEPVPKYWTSPGFKKGHALMNYDHATTWLNGKPAEFVIIVEGPMDVYRIGSPEGSCLPGPAVALYGHSLSSQQKMLLFNSWRDKTIVVMLDADAYTAAENIARDLKATGRFKAVLPILLPDNRDPADCEHSFIWKLLQRQASDVNLNLLEI